MAALFGAGHPVTAVGDPDQNIYAWRGASLYNLFRFPRGLPAGRRHARRAPAAVHELPLGRAHPGGGRHGDRRRCPRRSGRRASGSSRGRPTGRARCASRRVLDEWTEARRDRRPVRRAARRRAPPGPRWRCCAARRGCSGCCARPSTSAASRSRSSGSPGCCKHARGGRGARVRPRGARPDRERGARADPARRRATASGSRTSRCSPGWPPIETAQPARGLRAWRTTTSRPNRCCWPRRSSTSRTVEELSDEGRERLAEFREELRGAARRGAAAGRRVPRRGDPADRHPRRARRRPRPAPRARARAATSRRSSTRSTRSSRSTASSRCARSSTTSTRSSGSTSRSGRRCSPPTPTRSRS